MYSVYLSYFIGVNNLQNQIIAAFIDENDIRNLYCLGWPLWGNSPSSYNTVGAPNFTFGIKANLSNAGCMGGAGPAGEEVSR